MMNWGIVGPGKIAKKFANDLVRVRGARVHAVASRDLARSRAFAAEFGALHAFGSYAEMADCAGLDVVYVATPHAMHYENTMLFLEKGIAVLCEKPFAMNLQQAREMAEMAQRKGVFLMEAIWSRFVPGVRIALDWVAEGRIGDLRLVQADFGFKNSFDPHSRLYDKALGGGSLLDIGIYPVWLALTLLGKPSPENIRAVATFSPSGTDETCSFSFLYEHQRMALGLSTLAATLPTEARLCGDEGYLFLHTRWHHTQGITHARYDGRELHQSYSDHPYEGFGYGYEAAHVQDCLRQGLRESPLLPLHKTLDLMETLDAIRCSVDPLIGARPSDVACSVVASIP